jgi:hypothetical protein
MAKEKVAEEFAVVFGTSFQKAKEKVNLHLQS